MGVIYEGILKNQDRATDNIPCYSGYRSTHSFRFRLYCIVYYTLIRESSFSLEYKLIVTEKVLELALWPAHGARGTWLPHLAAHSDHGSACMALYVGPWVVALIRAPPPPARRNLATGAAVNAATASLPPDL